MLHSFWLNTLNSNYYVNLFLNRIIICLSNRHVDMAVLRIICVWSTLLSELCCFLLIVELFLSNYSHLMLVDGTRTISTFDPKKWRTTVSSDFDYDYKIILVIFTK